MTLVSRGFRGRRDDAPSSRVPPGQHLVRDFPILSAGPMPDTPLDEWTFSIVGEVAETRRWTWEEFLALPLEEVTGGKAWVAFAYGGEPLDPEHGGPVGLLVPHLSAGRGRRAPGGDPRARTLVLDVGEWPGHRPGQHVDVRLTAEDGYQAQRSYSIASAPGEGRLGLTVERLEDGEVSPYLVDELECSTRRARSTT